MEFRGAVITDLNEILDIIRQAQDYFKNKGIDQWQNNYPNANVISNDIESKRGYVLVDGDIIVGTVSVSFDGEKTYDHIEGEWLSSIDYAVVHRIAVRAEHKGKGLASVILKNIEHICQQKGIHSIRIDTHEDNLSMQRTLQKNGFTYCGVIYLQDGSKRLAFEKLMIIRQGR